MLTRRDFLKSGVLASAGFAVFWRGGTLFARAHARAAAHPVASEPEGILEPEAIPKFVSPLLIPPAMPRTAKLNKPGKKSVDYYEISVREFQQQILPASLPPTTVWGYGTVTSAGKETLALHNAPSLTIEANWNVPVRIKWINQLRTDPNDPTSTFLPHLLPVDPSLHWANPPGGVMGRDTRPMFTETPVPYRGPVPWVTHVHGSVGVGDESDGYAEAWYLPAAGDIPAGYAEHGTWYEFFAEKAAAAGYLAPETTGWESGSAVFQYPNVQRASALWFHDHTLGMTRLNVYAGPAGFFILRGGPAGDAAVKDSRTGRRAVFPGPAPKKFGGSLLNRTYYEIPMAIQDRAFKPDGSLFYPDSREFFDEIEGPFVPETDIAPIWNPEFFGNCIMVNGRTWPFLDVEQRRYRFRILNGCNSRFLILDFAHIPGVEVWQIGNEGGFLAAPVDLAAVTGGKLLMAPAERADVIVDFTNVPEGSFVLGNIGPDEPFGGGAPGVDFEMADADGAGQIMQFNVRARTTPDTTTPPQFMMLPPITPLTGGKVRRLALLEEMSMHFDDAPAAAMLGIVTGDPDKGLGVWEPAMWSDPITENPSVGDVEVWEFYNGTADAHPMHIHEVLFEVVNRQEIYVDEMKHTFRLAPGSMPMPPEPWETGYKDTVIAYPGQVTRLRVQFASAGQYVWHCHIVEHEDNEMMRPYRIGPEQPGQPGQRHQP